jgi:protein-S-isoprenylcysteine O-methyltransferase Ste14
MKAGALVFRFRVFLVLLLHLLGFLPPWEHSFGASDGTLWLAASTWIARMGWIGLAEATVMVTGVALTSLLLGTVLRVWGTAYLGSRVVRGGAMQGDRFVPAGPYRYVRNPLYLGSWLLAMGVSILMPPSGAGFFLIAVSLFFLVLISAEERFLSLKLGEGYQEYRSRVPRLLPSIVFRDRVSSARPQWPQALLSETYPIAFTACFAIFAWRYNARILVQGLLICYGLSLVVRALTTRTIVSADANAGL